MNTGQRCRKVSAGERDTGGGGGGGGGMEGGDEVWSGEREKKWTWHDFQSFSGGVCEGV